MVKAKDFGTEISVDVLDTQFYVYAEIFGSHGKIEDIALFHSHTEYELFSVENGELTVYGENGDTYEISPDKACMVPHGFRHRTVMHGDGARRRVMRFSFLKLENVSGGFYRDFEAAMENANTPVILTDASVCALMGDTVSELAETRMSYELAITSMLRLLWVKLMRAVGGERADGNAVVLPSDSDFIRGKKIENWLRGHYMYCVTEEKLAEVVGVSKRQLSRIFTDFFGMCFRDKLLEMRMNKAAELLLFTDMKIESVASAVGYSSATGFQIAFGKYYGRSPGRFRKNAKT